MSIIPSSLLANHTVVQEEISTYLHSSFYFAEADEQMNKQVVFAEADEQTVNNAETGGFCWDKWGLNQHCSQETGFAARMQQNLFSIDRIKQIAGLEWMNEAGGRGRWVRQISDAETGEWGRGEAGIFSRLFYSN